MRGSIKRQISVIFIGLVVAILLISLGVNAKFLGQYYILNKQASLTEVYEKLKTASEKGTLTSDSTVEKLSEMVEVGNITLAVVSGKEKIRLSIAQNEQKSNELVMQLIGYMLGRNQERGTLLKESDTYQIHSAKDVQSGYEYIEMWGYLEDGSTFILRSPLESIRESVALSNEFLSYIVVVVVLISTVFRKGLRIRSWNWRFCHREWQIWILMRNIQAAEIMRSEFLERTLMLCQKNWNRPFQC